MIANVSQLVYMLTICSSLNCFNEIQLINHVSDYMKHDLEIQRVTIITSSPETLSATFKQFMRKIATDFPTSVVNPTEISNRMQHTDTSYVKNMLVLHLDRKALNSIFIDTSDSNNCLSELLTYFDFSKEFSSKGSRPYSLVFIISRNYRVTLESCG